ncbi:MAG: hypothetical protein FWG70_10280 [Oscillospiraceae bacterium]|nr:hypothetical protein [Oscillospiraceae bacterium]
MFIFEKRTQMPVRIHNKNPKLAGFILTQYGGAFFIIYESGFTPSKSETLEL